MPIFYISNSLYYNNIAMVSKAMMLKYSPVYSKVQLGFYNFFGEGSRIKSDRLSVEKRSLGSTIFSDPKAELRVIDSRR